MEENRFDRPDSGRWFSHARTLTIGDAARDRRDAAQRPRPGARHDRVLVREETEGGRARGEGLRTDFRVHASYRLRRPRERVTRRPRFRANFDRRDAAVPSADVIREVPPVSCSSTCVSPAGLVS